MQSKMLWYLSNMSLKYIYSQIFSLTIISDQTFLGQLTPRKCVSSLFFRDKVHVNFFGFAWRCVAINGFPHHSETATNLFYFWAWMRLRLYVQACPPEDILKHQKISFFWHNSKVDLFLMCRRENETSQILNLYPRSFWQHSDMCERVSFTSKDHIEISGKPNSVRNDT